MSQLVQIETPRLVLRKFRIGDGPDVFWNYASDPEVTRYMTWNPHQDEKESIDFVARMVALYEKEETKRYVITEKGVDKAIGSIDIVKIHEGNIPEIGYCLGRAYWNKGYMSEALAAFSEYLFSLGYAKLLIEADSRNIGSIRVMEKNGFTFVGKQMMDIPLIEPGRVEIVSYSKERK